jgi:hypothetical protein
MRLSLIFKEEQKLHKKIRRKGGNDEKENIFLFDRIFSFGV